jgi:4-amino-4-deoxy-L-arabinose transferase-like glycosyltransferase
VRGPGITLSVVVPAHDEAPNIARLLAEVHAALDPTGLDWELIVVDDGSTDDTPSVLASLGDDIRLRTLRLPVRSGQTAALAAGFGVATGTLIATLDADLQCPPSEIPALLAILGDADLACGIRTGRHDPLRRRVASGLSNLARRCVLAPRIRDLACPLRVFRADALARVEALTPLFDGAHRWLPALFVLAGLRVVQRPVAHQARTAGLSKYTTAGRALPIARELLRVLGLALPRSRGLRVVVWTAALALVAVPYVYALGRWPLTEPDEGRNAEVAREMLQLGSWSVPYFNHLPYLDKPVLLFWLMAAGFRTVGVGELAARLPSALAAVATVALTFAIARALVGARRGAIAAGVLATMPLVFVFARLVIFDMLLTMLTTAALLCLLRVRQGGDARWWWPLAGVAMGLGVLAKGPVGFAIPLIAWAAGRGALPPAPRRAGAGPALAAVALGAAVVAPWLMMVLRHEPGFLRYAIVDETFLRFVSVQRFHRGQPIYYYAGVIAWSAGIWSVVLVAVVPELVRRWRAGGPDAAAIGFGARAVGALFVFFTCSASKRPQYLLPAMVPLAVLVAVGVTAAPRRAAAALKLCAVIVATGGLVAALVVGLRLVTTADLPPEVTSAMVASAGLFLFGWGAVAARAARRPALALACAGLFAPGLGLALLRPLGTFAEGRSSRALAARIPADSRVVCAEAFRTSLPFYLRRPVLLVSRNGGELTSNYVSASESRFMGGAYLRPVDGLADTLDADSSVLVLTAPWRLDDVQRAAGRRLVQIDADSHSLLLRPEG